VGNHHRIGVLAVTGAHLPGNFHPQALHTADSKRRVKAGVEETGILQGEQEQVKQFRTHRELEHLGAIGFAGTPFFHNLRLTNPAAVIDLLDDDCLQAALGSLRCHCRAVIAAGGGDDALESFFRGFVGTDGRPARLETARGIGGFILHQDGCPLAGRGDLPDGIRQVAQFKERRIPHLGFPLDAGDLGMGIAGVRHHAFVVKGDRRMDIPVVINAQRDLHDLVFPSHHACIGGIARAHSSASVPIVSSSGTTVPKLWL